MSRSDPTTTEALGALSRPLPLDRHSISRRRFLQGAALATGAAMGPSWLIEAAAAAAPIGPADGVLVLVTMAGGNDGLNTIVPVSDGTYYDRRGGLAIPAGRALSLSDDRGLHPALSALEDRWQQGELAVIEGVGVPDVSDLSHFSSMARWMAGTSGGGFHSGWLGRFIDGLPGGDDPFHGVAIGTSVPLLMQGQQRMAVGLPSTNNGIFAVSSLDDVERRQLDALSSLTGPTGLGPLADALAGAGQHAMAVAAAIEPVYGQELPDGDIKRQLDLAARLINANLGIRVVSVIYGDFDSHANQQPMHDARMADLNQGILAFYNKLDPAFSARTLLVAVSEFGRRVQANHSGGTDHGAANAVLAIGAQVRGGFYGELPSLTQLDGDGNLKPTVDYRSVYATVLDGWLGADSSQLLGARFEDLGFVARPSPARTTGGLNPTVASNLFRYRAQVVRLYLACFGRLPDTAGLDYWVSARRSGLSLVAVSDSFVASAELGGRTGALSNQAFVDFVYRNVMNRPPDEAGLAYWVSALDRGMSRGQVMLGFSESAELVAATAAQVEHVERNGPVARLYQAYFLRQGDPDGIHYWIGTGLPVSAVSNLFADSAEFDARYGNVDDSGFVDLVYTNVLGRAADPAGRAYWLGQLARGVSRGQVMLGFSESAELIARTGTLG